MAVFKWIDKSTLFKDRFRNSNILKLPFITHHHQREVNRLIKDSQLPIVAIFQPGIKLANKLTSSALVKSTCNSTSCPFKSKSCLEKNIVYQLTCTKCGEIYIGETQRFLHTRLKEHLRSVHYLDQKTAMGEHYKKKHPSTTSDEPFTYKVLDHAKDFTDRKLKESFWIQNLKPTLNRDSGWNI